MVWFKVLEGVFISLSQPSWSGNKKVGGNPVLVDPQPCSMIEMTDQIMCSKNSCTVKPSGANTREIDAEAVGDITNQNHGKEAAQ